MKKIVFLLPHQDDEIGVFEIIRRVKEKKNIIIIYLTKDILNKRNKESKKVLKRFQISERQIIFLGDKLNVEDQKIIDSLNKIYSNLLKILKNVKDFELFTPTWEGGHHDHDATFIIGTKLKYKMKVLHKHFPLYSKINSIFFNLLNPNKYAFNNFDVRFLKINFITGLKFFLNTFQYKSQYKTFFFLWPFLFFSYLIVRKQFIITNKKFKLTPPGKKKLWYEIRYNFKFSYFKKKTINFLGNKN